MIHEIALLGIEEQGYHGVFKHERSAGQPFVADLRFRIAIDPHGSGSDELAATADYSYLIDQVRNRIATNPVNLIETLARDLMRVAFDSNPAIVWVQVTLHKPEAPVSRAISDISVTVSGNRDEV